MIVSPSASATVSLNVPEAPYTTDVQEITPAVVTVTPVGTLPASAVTVIALLATAGVIVSVANPVYVSPS